MIRRFGWIVTPFGNHMTKINLWAIFVIGYSVEGLADAGFVFSDGADTWRALLRAQEALRDMAPLQLSATTQSIATSLQNKINECVALFEGDTPALNRSANVMSLMVLPESNVLVEVHDLAEQFETAFSLECSELNTFFIDQKGTHQTSLLMEVAVNNLSDDVIARLTTDTITDINAAGRCLALDSPTAAGFHMLRATEALMRDYYFSLSGKHLAKKHRNWANFITVLNANGADAKVTGFLDHIRLHYRNPIMHPEDTLTPSEAFSLFYASLSAINMLDSAMNP